MDLCAKPRPQWLRLTLVFLAVTAGFSGWAQNATPTPYYRWTTLAGHPTTGYADGTAVDALFNNPRGIAVDTNDNVYVADTANHVIRKISVQGVVTTLAGSPGNPGSVDGAGSAARFAFPEGIEIDADSNVYVADTQNNTLRKITPAGIVTTLAGKAGETGDGTGTLETVRFNRPSRIFADKNSNVYFGANASFRRITSTGIEDIAIDLNDPAFYENGAPTTVTARIMATDWNGNFYIEAGVGTATTGAPKIKRIVKLATDGTYAVLASSDYSSGLPYLSNSVSITRWSNDTFGNTYYVTQLISSIIEYRVYRINPDGSVEAAAWRSAARGGYADAPIDLSADSQGHVLHLAVSDDVVFKTEDNQLKVFAGTMWSNRSVDGTGTNARFANISGLATTSDGQVIVGDSNYTYNTHYYGSVVVRKVTAAGLTSTIYTSASSEGYSWVPAGVAVGPTNTTFLGSSIYGMPTLTAIPSNGEASLLSTGVIRNMGPVGASNTNQIFVAEPTRINRRSASGDWFVMAGSEATPEIKDAVGADARFYYIRDISIAPNAYPYVLDDASSAATAGIFIRKVAPDLAVTTVSENLIQTDGAQPRGMAYDANGNFVLTFSDDTIRLLTTDGTLQVIGGQSSASGTSDGLGSDARFYQPGKVTTDANNNIYVADNAGTTVRKGEFLGFNATITQQPQSVTVSAGTTAVFVVTAQGTPAPSYQWYFNNAAITGATSATLSISNAQTSNAGSYTVSVSNNLGTVISAAATLTVTTPNTPPPNNGGGSGGGGSPSLWFTVLLAALGLARYLRKLQLA